MAIYRASQAVLAEMERSGELALDYIDRFKHTGERVFTTGSGARVQVTVVDDFLCLHLESECAHETTCPKNDCHKLKSS
jgi:hypothetical protein